MNVIDKRIILFLILFVINIGFTKSEDKEYDRAYNRLLIGTQNMSLVGLEKSIDSLINVSNTSDQKIQSLLLMSTYQSNSNKVSKALFYALEGQKIALNDDNYKMQIITSRYLSTNFISINLPEEAIKHIKIAESANLKIPNSTTNLIEKAFINDEKAYYELYKKNYSEVIHILDLNLKLIQPFPKFDKLRIMISSHQLLGQAYLELEDYDKSRSNFLLSNEYTKDDVTNGMLNIYAADALITNYAGLATLEIKINNYSNALKYLKQAEYYMSQFPSEGAEIVVFTCFSKYHKALKQYKEASRFDELLATANVKNVNSTKEVFNGLMKLSAENEKRQNVKINYFIIFSLSTIFLITFLIYRIQHVKKREKIKYDELIKGVNNNTPLHNETTISNQDLNLLIKERDIQVMPKETEERILSDLLTFEKRDFFTESGISLSNLAKELNTNIKYLSYIINTHRGKDFNNYINELRIRYIVKKFQTEPKYSTYKMAYIAEEAGFSSSSKFSFYFKNITGLSPSRFLAQLKKNSLDDTKNS